MSAVAIEPVPGPPGLPLVGNLLSLGEDPLLFLDRVARFGDVAQFHVAGSTFYLVNDPALIETLLIRRRAQTRKDQITRGLDTVLGQGLLTSDGDHWRRQRKRIAPSFQPRHLAAYGEAMVLSTVERLPALGEQDIHEVMTAATLDVVMRTLFGAEPGGEADEVGPLLEGLMTSFETEQRTWWRLVPDWVPSAHRSAVVASARRLDTLMISLVQRARADAGEGDDLLSRLLAARDEDGRAMGDRELRDELVTLFLAGHETTALTLSYALWLLAEHPEHQARLQAELATLGDRDPTLADLRQMPFVDAVLKESMRLFPPAWAVGREATEDFELGGHRVRRGAQILASQWLVHRDPRWWVGAERFRPERWLNGETEDLHRFAYFPFGGGPRVCVGNHFATMEAKLMLATFLRHRSVRVAPGYAPDLLPAVTLRPRNGVRLVVTGR